MKRLFVFIILGVFINTISAGGGGQRDTPNRGGQPIASYEYDIRVSDMILSPARDKIVFLTARGLFLSSISDLSISPQPLVTDSTISVMTYHPDGSHIAFGDIFGNISVIDALTGEIIHTIKPDNQLIYALAYSTDGDTLAIGDGGGVIRLWHIPTNTITTIEDAHDYYVAELIYHPQENRLISTGGDSQIKLWDVSTDTPELLFETSIRPRTNRLTMNSDGSRLITSDENGEGGILLITNLEVIEQVNPYFYSNYVDFSDDGMWLLVVSYNEIQLWTVNPIELYAIVGSVGDEFERNEMNYAFFLPNTDIVISLFNQYTLYLWDIKQAEIIPPAD